MPLTTSSRLLHDRDAAHLAHTLRESGRQIVFTSGCFDILHFGHLQLLKEASRHGVVFVGVNSDDSVRTNKGHGRPLQPLCERMALLAELRSVDYVVSFEQATPLELILKIRPDILIKGGDYIVEAIVGSKEVMGWGGFVLRAPYIASRSTSRLIMGEL